MANAKFFWCKIFWFTIILLSIAITGVSIYYAAADFMAKPTDVTLVRKEGHEMLYPPLKLCIHHWMGWVNWTAASEMNFTKREVQYAMSYLTEIFSDDTFDVEEAEKSFYNKLQMTDIPSVEQFYKSIAYKNRRIINGMKEGSIPQYEITFADFWSWPRVGVPPCQLCYQFPSEEIRKVHMTDIENGLILKLKLSDVVAAKDDILNWLTESEYAAQIEGDNLCYNNHQMLNQLLPVRVYPDGFNRKLFGMKDGSRNVGVMNVKVLKKVSRASDPCHEGHRWITSDTTCTEKCILNKSNSGYIDTSKNRKIFLVSKMEKRIPFGQKFRKTLVAKYKEKEIKRKLNQTTIARDQYFNVTRVIIRERYDEQCLKSCKREAGCESWSYSFQPAKGQIAEDTANVVIIYPSSITATNEIYIQTWENFTSNIGGLLGIFLDASFLTIFQAFQFCCKLCHKKQVGVIQVQST